ncbi:hypothetical protein T261_02721 [Streptomyces lydicus]|nr:hypothetical protein T261_02721 [Streptomyces lydicus]
MGPGAGAGAGAEQVNFLFDTNVIAELTAGAKPDERVLA